MMRSFACALVILEAAQSLNSEFPAQEDTRVAPKDLIPLQAGKEHFDFGIIEGASILFEVLIIDLFGVLEPAEAEDVEDIHFEVCMDGRLLLSSSYFWWSYVSRYST